MRGGPAVRSPGEVGGVADKGWRCAPSCAARGATGGSGAPWGGWDPPRPALRIPAPPGRSGLGAAPAFVPPAPRSPRRRWAPGDAQVALRATPVLRGSAAGGAASNVRRERGAAGVSAGVWPGAACGMRGAPAAGETRFGTVSGRLSKA